MWIRRLIAPCQSDLAAHFGALMRGWSWPLNAIRAGQMDDRFEAVALINLSRDDRSRRLGAPGVGHHTLPAALRADFRDTLRP